MPLRKRYVYLLVFLFFPIVFVSSGLGQYREYYIYGKVVDTEKKPVVGVEIYLRDEAASRSYRTKTDKKGEFKLAGLPHGTYRVTIRKEGYQTFEDKWELQTPQDRMQKVEIPTIVLATVEKIREMTMSKEAKAEFDEAVEKIRREDFEGAASILDKMIARNPDDANAHYLRGMIFFKKKMLPEARAKFVRTTELAPSFAGAYHQLGLIHREQGEQEKALEYYHKAAELDPKSGESLYNAGLILFEMNQISEALTLFEKALLVKPDDPELLEMAGRCYIHQREYSRAIDCLEKAKKGYSNKEKIEFLDQLITKLRELKKQ
ncbi:MAG: tetratricopeptide repeat protein [Clostridiales bacterium]|nr:tetratricopeptide repeat protein [Clostridiales bacterium]